MAITDITKPDAERVLFNAQARRIVYLPQQGTLVRAYKDGTLPPEGSYTGQRRADGSEWLVHLVGVTYRAQDLAWLLHHRKAPRNRVVLRDGNPTNLRPQNMLQTEFELPRGRNSNAAAYRAFVAKIEKLEDETNSDADPALVHASLMGALRRVHRRSGNEDLDYANTCRERNGQPRFTSLSETGRALAKLTMLEFERQFSRRKRGEIELDLVPVMAHARSLIADFQAGRIPDKTKGPAPAPQATPPEPIPTPAGDDDDDDPLY